MASSYFKKILFNHQVLILLGGFEVGLQLITSITRRVMLVIQFVADRVIHGQQQTGRLMNWSTVELIDGKSSEPNFALQIIPLNKVSARPELVAEWQ